MTRKLYFILFILGIGLPITARSVDSQPNLQPEPRYVAGWIETVKLLIAGSETILLDAKLDTGADHSSLGATNISEYKIGKSSWVEFTITDSEGNKIKLNEKLYRHTKVKRRGKEPEIRPVIVIKLKIGPKTIFTPVSLVNRLNFKYQLLIGRSALMDFYIDPSAQRRLVYQIPRSNG